MHNLRQLLQLILQSPVLESVDFSLVKEFSRTLPLTNVNIVSHVNEAIKNQIDIESGIIYLYNKYKGMKHRTEDTKNKEWYILVKLNGPRSPENHIAPNYINLTNLHTEYNNLCGTFKDVMGMIFARRGELEQLSVNYRKELPSD